MTAKKKSPVSEYQLKAERRAAKLCSAPEVRRALGTKIADGSYVTIPFYGAHKERGFLFSRATDGSTSRCAFLLRAHSGTHVRISAVVRLPDSTYRWCTVPSCRATKEGATWKVLVFHACNVQSRELSRERFRILLDYWLQRKDSKPVLDRAETAYRKQELRYAERKVKDLKAAQIKALKALAAAKKALKEWENRK